MFVHAGIYPGLPLYDQDPNTMMWIRDVFLYYEEDHEYRIIHGHCPTKGFVDFRANRVNMDTDAVFNGMQYAIALHDGEERLLHTPQFETLNEIKQRG